MKAGNTGSSPGSSTSPINSKRRNELFVSNLLNQISENFQKKRYDVVLALCDKGIIRLKGFGKNDMEFQKMATALAEMYSYAGLAYEQLEQDAETKKNLKKNDKKETDPNTKDAICRSCGHFGRLQLNQEERKQAFEYLEERLKVTADPEEQIQARITIARTYYHNKDYAKATTHLKFAFKAATTEKDYELMCQCLLLFGEMLGSQGERDTSVKYLNRAVFYASKRGPSFAARAKEQVQDILKHSSQTGESSGEENHGGQIDIQIDDNDDENSSQRNKIPIQMNDDDSFMPPTIADTDEVESGVQGGSSESRYPTEKDPSNTTTNSKSRHFVKALQKTFFSSFVYFLLIVGPRADPSNDNFWKLSEEDALRRRDFRRSKSE